MVLCLKARESRSLPGLKNTAAIDAGWSSLVARQAHNLKVAGSNPGRLENRIIFLGLIKDVYSLYQDMDFIINTSLEEGSSNTLLEALSMKLPIICFDIGGNKDFFNNNGFLVKYKDYENLKKTVYIN